ncbi:hypothetical protein QT987_24855 [Microcoleus sp. SVA1B4]|uniref:hypothetical protein n=1 Tax=Microcoleus sp. B4-C5 TaxID=2818664 RepID=UPI002FCF5567
MAIGQFGDAKSPLQKRNPRPGGFQYSESRLQKAKVSVAGLFQAVERQEARSFRMFVSPIKTACMNQTYPLNK